MSLAKLWSTTVCDGPLTWACELGKVTRRGSASTALSHTRTVVRECCKGDDASQWENGKFDPLPRSNP